MKVLFCTILWIVASQAYAEGVPHYWQAELGDDAQKVWDACTDDGTFYPTRLISIFRQLGSQHDGDRQFEVARLLAVAPQDPYESLLYFTHSPDPYDRGFAIQVIDALGDRRFTSRLTLISEDSGSLKEWDMLRTVGEAARSALKSMDSIKFVDESTFPVADWIKVARKQSK